MKLYSLKCPNCSSYLDIEDGIDTFYCKYCGTKLILQGRDNNALNAKVKLRQIDADKEVKLKKLENERKEKEIDKKIEVVGFYFMCGIFAIIMIAFIVILFVKMF